MNWIIVNRKTGRTLNDRGYLSETDARGVLLRLGETFSSLYHVVPDYHDPKWHRVLTEGMTAGDLQGILLPQFSIDVYVPSDEKTDNIVIAFMLKGVPEAVFPFKNFCNYARGVEKVDYGDSDTLPKTSIVYAEFARQEFDIRDFFDLVEQICKLGGLQPSDLSVTYPTTNEAIPYTPQSVAEYFNSRDRDKNRLAQWKANHARRQQIQKELEDEFNHGIISKRLGGGQGGNGPANPTAPAAAEGHGLKRLQHPEKAIGKKDDAHTEIDIPETIKASIVADAKRNRTNHQFQWKDFDTRWAQRLHVAPNRISTIRKTIYDKMG